MKVDEPRVTLLVSTYNWLEALNLSLTSLLCQTKMPCEIVIADDGSRSDTKELIDSFREKFPIPIIHCWQEDKGFRRTRILNTAIAASSGDYIIQIDGDIFLEKHFVEDHISQMRKHTFIRGSRALLTSEATEQMLGGSIMDFNFFSKGVKNRINFVRSKILAKIFCRYSPNPRNVNGCNLAFWKKDFIAVNGYNNDIEGWGCEDSEFTTRLYNNGTRMCIIKFLAIEFHLYHKVNSRHNYQNNLFYYFNVAENKITRCANGYKELLDIENDDRKIWR